MLYILKSFHLTIYTTAALVEANDRSYFNSLLTSLLIFTQLLPPFLLYIVTRVFFLKHIYDMSPPHSPPLRLFLGRPVVSWRHRSGGRRRCGLQMSTLIILILVMVLQVYSYVKIHQIVLFKYV